MPERDGLASIQPRADLSQFGKFPEQTLCALVLLKLLAVERAIARPSENLQGVIEMPEPLAGCRAAGQRTRQREQSVDARCEVWTMPQIGVFEMPQAIGEAL